MAGASAGHPEVHARIVYWGIPEAGKSTNLGKLYEKLKPDHRGDLKRVPTRLDPSVSYEILPIELGEISGVRTQIEVVAPPGSPEHAPTRKQLLDQVDGVVLVVDSRKERFDDNLESFRELGEALASYGRSFDDVPVVVQFNKSDLADVGVLEELHRQLQLTGAAVFESVATEGRGVLETLTTISKRVIRVLRERGSGGAAAPPVRPESAPEPSVPLAEPEPILAEPLEAEPEPMLAEPLEAEPEPMLAEPLEAEPEPMLAEPIAAESVLPSRTAALEEAILLEDGHPEGEEIAATALEAEAVLDASWSEVASTELEGEGPLRLGADLSIFSVGKATKLDDRTVRVPLLLGDPDGATLRVALTLKLDMFSDETDA